MEWQTFLRYLGVMAGVTYLIRAVPFVLSRGKITNPFWKSFFDYIPYAVLGAMTFPAILYSTDGVLSAVAGMMAAMILAYWKKGLFTVAAGACIVDFLVQLFV